MLGKLLREIFAKCAGCGRRPSIVGIWRELVGEGVTLEYHPRRGGWLCADCWLERRDPTECNLCHGKKPANDLGVCDSCFDKLHPMEKSHAIE